MKYRFRSLFGKQILQIAKEYIDKDMDTRTGWQDASRDEAEEFLRAEPKENEDETLYRTWMDVKDRFEPEEDEDVETHVRYTKARGFFVAPDERESKDHMGEIPEFWKNHWQRVRADKGEGK